MLRKFLVLIAAALLLLPALVWDGARWIWKQLRPPAPVDVAGAIADEAIAAEAQVPSPPEKPRLGDVVRAHANYELWGGAAPSLADLPEHIELWLHSLTTQERSTVAMTSPTRIEEHVAGRRRIEGVSQVLSLDTYRSQQAAALSKAESLALQKAETLEILQDLVDYPTWDETPGHGRRAAG